jgi:hypothetical protein
VIVKCPTRQIDEFNSLQTMILQGVDSGLQEVVLPIQAGEAKEQNANRPQTHIGLMACQLNWGSSPNATPTPSPLFFFLFYTEMVVVGQHQRSKITTQSHHLHRGNRKDSSSHIPPGHGYYNPTATEIANCPFG